MHNIDEALGQFISNLIMNKEYLFSKRQFCNQIQFEAKNHCGIEKCMGPSPKKTWLCKCYIVKVKTNDDFCKYGYCRIRNVTKQAQELMQQKLIVLQLHCRKQRHTRHLNAAVEILHCFKLWLHEKHPGVNIPLCFYNYQIYIEDHFWIGLLHTRMWCYPEWVHCSLA